jgi:hypothetical protein
MSFRTEVRRQEGLFTRAQAIAAGWTERRLERAVERGTLERVEVGVYRAAPAGALTRPQRLLALVLSTGGVAYGRSACAVHGLVPHPASPEVLVVRPARNRTRAGLHSTRTLPPSDVCSVGGIPTTMPARSVCDAAADLPFHAVVELVDAAVVQRRVRPEALLRRAMELRNSKRPGCTKVLKALAAQHPRLDQARNAWEALVLRLAGRYGLPEPVPNLEVVVGGERRFLDAAWPDHLVDLEFDGFRPHMVRKVFDDDRARQNALVAAGWQVFRATSTLLEREPHKVFGPLAAAIRRRGHQHRPVRRVS